MTSQNESMLYDLLKNNQEQKTLGFNKTPKYVIYARKSTDEKGKQSASIEDQIIKCEEYAIRNGLDVLKEPLIEKRSAKISGLRPIFTKMLEDIQTNKYDSILCWHPDRLSRNMKEAGEIIDFIDRGIINDLQFASYTFDKSPSGIMTLGIIFAISKEYSDKLSINVKRGSHRRIEEGKWLGPAKLGYFKDGDSYLKPEMDFGTFELWKEVWQKRIAGESYEKIVEFLKDKNIQTTTKQYLEGDSQEKRMKPYKITKQKLSAIFSDPFYAGVSTYGDKIIYLPDHYPFQPMITEDDFFAINNVSLKNRKSFVQKNRSAPEDKQFLLRNRVFCAKCNKAMRRELTSKIVAGEKKWTYRFRCSTKGCVNNRTSIRAKTIKDFAVEFFKQYNFGNKQTYNHYQKEMNRLNKVKTESIRANIYRLTGDKQAFVNEISRLEKSLNSYLDNKGLTEHLYTQYNTQKKGLDKIKLLIKEEKGKEKQLKTGLLSYEKFLELMQEIPYRFDKAATIDELNFLLEKVYSNLVIDDQKILTYTLQSPFKEFVEKGFVLKSALTRTRT